MDSLNIDASNISGLVQTLSTSGASELGFMAGVLLVLVIIMIAFAIATFVLGIVATVKATKAGRACGWEPAMAKASLGFGIFAIVSPLIALKVPDGMGATFVLVAGFIVAIVAIASASNRLKLKAIADRAPIAASREDNPVPEAPALANLEAAEHAAQVAVVESQSELSDETVNVSEDSLVYDGEDANRAEMAAQITEPLEVISGNEALVNPVDPTEPVIEDETPSSVDDMQVDEQTEKADGEEFGDDDAAEDVSDDIEGSDDDFEEEEEYVEPMHKMTSDERDAEIAAIKADAAQRAADRAAAKARALERAAEDPEYAAYLLEQGKLKGSLKKND